MPLQPTYIYRARLLSVHDGDTLWLDVDQGLRGHVHWRFRVKDLWCAELNTPEGKAAKQFVVDLLTGHEDLVIETEKVRTSNADTVDAMSLDRFVAIVQLADGRLLADVVVAAGHGTATRS